MIGFIAAIAGVLAVPTAGGLAYRKVRQRQVAQALVIDTPNGLAEERFVRVGGIDQWIQIRGEDRGNPVLLGHAHRPAASQTAAGLVLRLGDYRPLCRHGAQ